MRLKPSKRPASSDACAASPAETERLAALRRLASVATDKVSDELMPSLLAIVQLMAAIAVKADPWAASEQRCELAEQIDNARELLRKVDMAATGAGLLLRSAEPFERRAAVDHQDVRDAMAAIVNLDLNNASLKLCTTLPKLLLHGDAALEEQGLREDLTDSVRRLVAAGDVMSMMINANGISTDLDHRRSKRGRAAA